MQTGSKDFLNNEQRIQFTCRTHTDTHMLMYLQATVCLNTEEIGIRDTNIKILLLKVVLS